MKAEGASEGSMNNMSRYMEIAGALSRHGFVDLLGAFKTIRGFKAPEAIPVDDALALNRWEKIRRLIEELGPTYIKLGQLLSNRPDLLPLDLIKELEKLQSNAPAFSFVEFKNVLESELKVKVEEIFQYLDPVPVGSASLAQVHKGVLKTGELVVVKLQRPDIIPRIRSDIQIMRMLAQYVSSHNRDLEFLDPVGLVGTFEATLFKELNYNYEVLNIERFRDDFRDDPDVHVPAVYREYCTERVIVMEFIGGFNLSDAEGMAAAGISLNEVARKGMRAFFKQVFLHGFFHADPHPGNIVIMNDGRICYIDFGMMGHLLPRDKDQVGALFIAIDQKDPEKLLATMKRLSHTRWFVDEPKLKYRLTEFLELYILLSSGQMKMSELMEEFRQIILDFKIPIPPDFFLLLKAITITEGMAVKLDPRANVVKELQPYTREMLRRKFSPEALYKGFYMSAMDIADLIRDFPSDAKEIVEKIKSGNLKLEIEHRGLHKLNHELDKVSNRVSFSILTASMLIGSAILVHSRVPPIIYEMPLLGLIGFIFSGIFAFRLIVSIWRGGKL